MEDESDSDAGSPNLLDLPPFHRFYTPQTEGNLYTQLGDYKVANAHGIKSTLHDRARLAYAVNELAATTLGLGKLYLLKPILDRKLEQKSPHPIPDLLFVGTYKWTAERRDAFLELKPSERLPMVMASLSDQDPTDITLPVFVFDNFTPPCVRVDQSLKVNEPPWPDKGVWICTRTAPFRAGMVQDVVKMGIIVGPYNARGERVNWVGRRLDMAYESHRSYLREAEVAGQDQIAAVYHWLQRTQMYCPVLVLEVWEKIVKMIDELLEEEEVMELD